MQRRLRSDPPDSPPAVRQIIGVHVAADCREVRAVPVLACGNGLHLKVRVGRSAGVELPKRAAESFAELGGQKAAGKPVEPLGRLSELRKTVAEHAAIAAQDTATENRAVFEDTLAIGVCESGIWPSTPPDGPIAYFSLNEASLLANLSGINVVDGFPARDVACGGSGGPLSPLAEWILFRSAHCERILVQFGRSTRLTRLPRLSGSLSSIAGLAQRAVPGMDLVDLLVTQLTHGQRVYDPGGRFSVQGRRIGELVERWLDLSRTPDDPAEWSPRGIPVVGLLRDAVASAVEKGWTVYDMLCSAAHFVAEGAVRAIGELAGTAGNTEILLSGAGLANGLVLRALTAGLAGRQVRRIQDLGVRSEALAPAVAAILAVLHLDQVPANVAGLTGAEVPRVLGRLTPGRPQAWQKLLASCVQGGSNVRPLRAAL